MAKLIIVDFEALRSPESLASVKNLVIEHLVRHPDTLLTVLNPIARSNPIETETHLTIMRFPHDALTCNPLGPEVPTIVFKTMFAARLQEHKEHDAILVVDSDRESAAMWRESGIRNVYSPEGAAQ
jgi:hypothetical protein